MNPRFEDNFYRSEALRPTGIVLDWEPGFQPQHFEHTIAQRRMLLRQKSIELLSESELLEKGRLILINPVDTVADGTAALHSEGFFDYYELAPWDTWVAFAEDIPELTVSADCLMTNYLIVWVPNSSLNQVYCGRVVCMMDNISWLRELRTEPLSSVVFEHLFTEPPGLTCPQTISVEEADVRVEHIHQTKSVVKWVVP